MCTFYTITTEGHTVHLKSRHALKKLDKIHKYVHYCTQDVQISTCACWARADEKWQKVTSMLHDCVVCVEVWYQLAGGGCSWCDTADWPFTAHCVVSNQSAASVTAVYLYTELEMAECGQHIVLLQRVPINTKLILTQTYTKKNAWVCRIFKGNSRFSDWIGIIFTAATTISIKFHCFIITIIVILHFI